MSSTLSSSQVHPPRRRSESRDCRARGCHGHDSRTHPSIVRCIERYPACRAASGVPKEGRDTGISGTPLAKSRTQPCEPGGVDRHPLTRACCCLPAALERCRSTEGDAGNEWTRFQRIRAAPLPPLRRKIPAACRNAQVDTGSTGSERMTYSPGHATEDACRKSTETEPTAPPTAAAVFGFATLKGSAAPDGLGGRKRCGDAGTRERAHKRVAKWRTGVKGAIVKQ
jgi:hypothetical protein